MDAFVTGLWSLRYVLAFLIVAGISACLSTRSNP